MAPRNTLPDPAWSTVPYSGKIPVCALPGQAATQNRLIAPVGGPAAINRHC